MQQLVKSLSYILSLSLIVFLLPISNTNASTPTYVYEWVSQSGTISNDRLAHEYTNLEAGQTINLSLTLLNRSNATIKKLSEMGPHGPHQAVAPGVWGIGSQTPHQDGTPHFLDLSSFIVNNNRFVYYNGPDVPNGQPITMSWNIKLASNLSDGVYNLYVKPVSEYLAWTRQIKNGKLLPTTSSDIFWRLTVGEGNPTVVIQNEFSFQVDIPSGYRYEERPVSGEEIYNAEFIVSDLPYSDNVSIYIAQCHYESDADCLNSLYNGLSSSSPEFERYLTIGGKMGIYYDSSKTAGGYGYYVVSNKGLKYIIRGNPNSKTAEDMVGTFRFI